VQHAVAKSAEVLPGSVHLYAKIAFEKACNGRMSLEVIQRSLTSLQVICWKLQIFLPTCISQPSWGNLLEFCQDLLHSEN